MNPIRALLASFSYVRAGDYLQQEAYADAKRCITKAMRILGKRNSEPGLFEFHLRSALIDERLGNVESSTSSVQRAMQGIDAYSRLNPFDRKYLLDYCRRFLVDLGTMADEVPHEISEEEYDCVTRRYRREYPLKWVD